MKAFSFLFSLFFLLLFPSIGLSQITFSGTVVDSLNTSIEYASIYAFNEEDSTLQVGTFSDNQGQFSLELPKPGLYSFRIRYVGFKDVEVINRVSQSVDNQKIVMFSSLNTLTEVTIEGARKIIEYEGDKLLFNVGSSPFKSGYDAMEILERTPSVMLNQDEEIMIRNQHARILINGRATTMTGADLSAYLSNIPSDQIKRIEVQTRLGANTDAENAGGVINIVLSKKPKGFDGNVRSDLTVKSHRDYGVFGGAMANYGAEKWNIYGYVNQSEETSRSESLTSLNYFLTQRTVNTDAYRDSKRNTYNFQVGFVTDISSKQTLGLEYFGSRYKSDFENRGDLTYSNDAVVLETGTADLFGDVRIQPQNAVLNYAFKMDTLGSELKVFGDYTFQKYLDNSLAISQYNENFLQPVEERFESNANTGIFSLQVDLEKKYKSGLALDIGTKYTETNRENRLFRFMKNSNGTWPEDVIPSSDFTYQEQITAAYFTVKKELSKSYYFEVGLRAEQTNLNRIDFLINEQIPQNYLNWFPSVYVSKRLEKEQKIAFSYSKRLRRPSFRDLNSNIFKVNDFRYYKGNPDLQPQYVHRFDLDFNQKKQSWTAYYNKTFDAINGVFFLEDSIAFYQRFNAGAQTQYGLDYRRFGNLLDWWYMNASLGVYNRKFTDDAGLDAFQRVTARLNMTHAFSINKTTGIDISGYYYTPTEDAFYIEYERYRMNLLLKKSYLNNKLLFRLYLNDFLDLFLYKNERPFPDFSTSRIHNPQTRTVRLWMRYSFSGKEKVKKRRNASQNGTRRRL